MWSGVWWTPIHWSPGGSSWHVVWGVMNTIHWSLGGSSWHVVWTVMNTHTLVSRWQQLTCGLGCDEHHTLVSRWQQLTCGLECDEHPYTGLQVAAADMWSGVWWTPIHWSPGGSSWHVVWGVMNTHTLVSRWQQLTCGLECDEHPYTGLQVAAADMWSGVWWTPIHWSPGGSSWHVVWSVMNTTAWCPVFTLPRNLRQMARAVACCHVQLKILSKMSSSCRKASGLSRSGALISENLSFPSQSKE